MSSHTPYGATLRERRQAAGQTQAQLADAAGTSHQYISLIERGALDPREDLRNRLDAALTETERAANFGPFGDYGRLAEQHHRADDSQQATA